MCVSQRGSCIAYKLLFLCGSSKWYPPTCKEHSVVPEYLFFFSGSHFWELILVVQLFCIGHYFAFVFQNYCGSICLSTTPM